MVAHCRPLIEVLGEIPDPRHARGKRHPLPAILALVCAAVLCGYRSYSAVAEWARIYPPEVVRALGFTRPQGPCAGTLCTLLQRLDRAALEAKLGAWAEGVLASLPAGVGADEAVALDGKTLRGSRQQGAVGVHLLAALSHRLGLTLGQRAVDDKSNEITAIGPLLRGLLLEGRIFTVDALLTQRAVARTIVDGGGDYVMVVKENQPQLLADIRLVFTDPPVGDDPLRVQTSDSGHGRSECRSLTLSRALADYSDWPGAQQVFQLQRRVVTKKTGAVRTQTVYGLTSLDRPRADAARVLALTRHHWHIENRSHYVRDVFFAEDRSQVRCGATPQVMAAFRNTAIGLLRLCGEGNIAATGRRLAAQPRAALALLGIPTDY